MIHQIDYIDFIHQVAERVAQERCEECGTERTVGYQIRLEK